eukprot:g8208.t2
MTSPVASAARRGLQQVWRWQPPSPGTSNGLCCIGERRKLLYLMRRTISFQHSVSALVGRTRLSRARHRPTNGAATARRHSSSSSGAPPPRAKRASLFAAYNSLLESRPLTTKAVSSGAIAFAGDVTCQMLAIEVARREEEQSPPETADEHDIASGSRRILNDLGAGDVASEIDWGRTLRFTFVGAAVLAPSLHLWYGFLIRRLPGTAPATVVKRVALDQLLFAPVFLAGFLSTVMLLDGKAAKIEHKLRADYTTTVVSNWGYWIPAQVVNFRFVAPVYQVLYANFVGFFWNIYLSYQSNKKVLKDSTPDGLGVPPQK